MHIKYLEIVRTSMEQQRIVRPYRGSDPYVFISYSHKDKREVTRILNTMETNGFRIWFDEGIDPGTEWDENIAIHIKNCGCFFAFVSNNYLQSDNCKDELNYARDLNKQRILIYLEQVSLPDGMSMRLNRLQAIHYYLYILKDDFYEKIYEIEGIDLFIDKGTCSFNSIDSQEVNKTTVNCLKSFADNTTKHRFLFLTGSNFQLKKKVISAVIQSLNKKNLSYIYFQMEKFTDELINSIQTNTISEFRQKFVDVPFLILEDVEFICGKSATQEECYILLKKRFYNDMPTLVIAHKDLSYYSFDERIIALLSEWESITA